MHARVRSILLAVLIAGASACAPSDAPAPGQQSLGESAAAAGAAAGPAGPAAADSDAPLAVGACLRGDPAQGVPWRIEHASDSAQALELVPLATLPPRDSARIAARVARAADVLPADTSIADFRGLPVAVRDAWVLVPAPGDTIVIAVVARRQPMESAPLEEHLAVITTPDTLAGTRRPLTARWVARSVGTEEQLETHDPLVAFRAADGTLRLLFVEESAVLPQVEMVARDAAGRWVPRWSGPLAPCP